MGGLAHNRFYNPEAGRDRSGGTLVVVVGVVASVDYFGGMGFSGGCAGVVELVCS